MALAIKRSDAIQDVLAQACARNELVILVTPYLRFESFFMALGKGELQVAATMSREDASFGLRGAELKVCFPVGLGFMEGPVQLLGLGVHDGKRTLRLSIPKQLLENDDRTEYRVERVGRVTVTYGTPKGDLLQASLVDLNTRGARIHAQRDLTGTTLQVGSVLILSIPLDDEIQIEARGEIRHMGPREHRPAVRPEAAPGGVGAPGALGVQAPGGGPGAPGAAPGDQPAKRTPRGVRRALRGSSS